jgi:hypothetical protein
MVEHVKSMCWFPDSFTHSPGQALASKPADKSKNVKINVFIGPPKNVELFDSCELFPGRESLKSRLSMNLRSNCEMRATKAKQFDRQHHSRN